MSAGDGGVANCGSSSTLSITLSSENRTHASWDACVRPLTTMTVRAVRQASQSELRDRPLLVRALKREQKTLGAKVRALRVHAGMSQEFAAEKIGLSDRQLRRLELGETNVTLATLVAVAQAFRVGLPELFYEEP